MKLRSGGSWLTETLFWTEQMAPTPQSSEDWVAKMAVAGGPVETMKSGPTDPIPERVAVGGGHVYSTTEGAKNTVREWLVPGASAGLSYDRAGDPVSLCPSRCLALPEVPRAARGPARRERQCRVRRMRRYR